ncbi:hypothetical protein BC332_23007 [Capsicum chinense]|nr:hypothetical protein BC332_23007 [Capsicum chinense]
MEIFLFIVFKFYSLSYAHDLKQLANVSLTITFGSKLYGKNLTGNIPSELTKFSSVVELWLDGNSLTGPIPDFSGCPDLQIM